MAQKIFKATLWIWSSVVLIIALGYLIGILPNPAKGFLESFQASVLGWLFLGPYSMVTYSILSALLATTILSGLEAYTRVKPTRVVHHLVDGVARGVRRLTALAKQNEKKIRAAICYILFWVSGSIMLLIEEIFLKGKRNRFVLFHAGQSTIYFAILSVGFILIWVAWHLALSIFYSYQHYAEYYRPILASIFVALLLETVCAWFIGLIQSFRGKCYSLFPIVTKSAYRRPALNRGLRRLTIGLRYLSVCIIGLLLANFFFFPPPIATSYGAMFGFDPHHTHEIPNESILSSSNVAKLVRAWVFPGGPIRWSSPAVANGIVYVGSDGGDLYALDAVSGKMLWYFSTRVAFYSSPAVANGIVYVGSDDHSLYALDATSGKMLWSYPTGGVIRSSPTVVNGHVYVGSDDGSLYALDATSGKMLWSYPTAGAISSSPTIVNGMVYLGSEDGSLYAFHLST